MKSAVVVFPGSNSDYEAYHVLKHVLGQPTDLVWHKETSLHGYDTVVLPGGFAHGDYLRAGAIARFSPRTLDSGTVASGTVASGTKSAGLVRNVKSL